MAYSGMENISIPKNNINGNPIEAKFSNSTTSEKGKVLADSKN